MRRLLMKQGLAGPHPGCMVGNMHEIAKLRTEVAATDMEVGHHDIMVRVAIALLFTAPNAMTSTSLTWGGMDIVAVGGKVALSPIPLRTSDSSVGRAPPLQLGRCAYALDA
ncbi:hypothetical protein O6H91_10G091500 [Diphasiastrum complanatum]|uniref:Uncharacterized protein n=1 Tax=Diphasiastrum complanatum TaxID=34168 RepID=A0ACC2CJI3_DIPCM|nr:hypothetical protein O6H91_10G091500 [Diphasiastrum complanatum]